MANTALAYSSLSSSPFTTCASYAWSSTASDRGDLRLAVPGARAQLRLRQPRGLAQQLHLASEAAQEAAARLCGTLGGAGHRNVHGPALLRSADNGTRVGPHEALTDGSA
jgi:hypothetical protein